MEFAQERLADALNEIKPLLQEHWQEIARNRDFIALSPDYAAYLHLDAAGLLRLYTARREGALAGYSIYFVRPHLHYANNIWAVSDIVYLAPAARRGTCGVRLQAFAEAQLTAEGVHVMHTTSKLEHPALARVMEYLGHKPIEVGHAKVLNRGP